MSSEITEVSNGDNSLVTVTSNSSSDSNSRETDDARLQIQTRIWVGEVLQKALDEETDISDILADGTLLYELSEVLSGMLALLETNERKSFISTMSLQPYKRFDYVGIFLEMCTSMGVAGIDLFSPSDVVDKKDTRKVCMCIRALSMKARSRGLNVPDFDNLTRLSGNGYSHTPQSNHPFNGVMAEGYRLLDASNDGEIINTDDAHVINSFSLTIDDHQPGTESPRGFEGIGKGKTEDVTQESRLRFADQSGLSSQLIDGNYNFFSKVTDNSVTSFSTTTRDNPQPGTGPPGNMLDASYDRLQCVEDSERVNNTEPLDGIENAEHIKQEGSPKNTPQRNWWELVAKGTAILCIAIIVLHPRKSRQENVSQERKQPVEVPKQSTAALLTENSQKDDRTSNIYPAEKLRFGF